MLNYSITRLSSDVNVAVDRSVWVELARPETPKINPNIKIYNSEARVILGHSGNSEKGAAYGIMEKNKTFRKLRYGPASGRAIK